VGEVIVELIRKRGISENSHVGEVLVELIRKRGISENSHVD